MPRFVPRTPLVCLVMSVRSSELDLDVDAGRQVKPHQRVDRLRRGVDDVDQPLVRAHLEVLPRVLVLVRGADDAVDVLLRGQRDRPGNPRAGARHRVDDLPRRAVDDLVVVGLEPDADLLSRHVPSVSLSSKSRYNRRLAKPLAGRPLSPAARGAAGDSGPLLDDLRDPAGADGAATLADSEAQALLHGDGLDELDAHLGVVAGHHHLGALGQVHNARHVRGPEVELRTVVVEERGVPAALILGQDVDLALELGVRGVGARLDDDLAALHVLALDAAEQQARVVAGLALVKDLVEHLDAGDRGPLRLLLDPDELDFLTGVHLAALDPAGHHGAPTTTRQDILDRHQERLLGVPDPLRDAVVTGVHELDDLLGPLCVTLERLERGDPDHRDVVARELVGAEQLTYLELDQLQDLLVVHHVGLVQRDHDVRHAALALEQHVLAGLRHGAVGGGDHEDGAVHLRGTGDHVLDVVRVTGAVHVCVVALLGLVLDVRDRNGDPALLLFLRVVDLVEGREGVHVGVLIVQHLGDRRGQSGLAVVDVPDGADVHVRLGPLELGLPHWFLLVAICPTSAGPRRFVAPILLIDVLVLAVTHRALWR